MCFFGNTWKQSQKVFIDIFWPFLTNKNVGDFSECSGYRNELPQKKGGYNNCRKVVCVGGMPLFFLLFFVVSLL